MTMENLYQLYLQHPTICTDTRNIKPDSIFFCLKGENFDGNQFALQALSQGAAHVVTENQTLRDRSDCTVVANTLETLQLLARHHRRQLTIPVIGITGTNGKTTTKELTAAVLSRKFRTAFTQGNLNNHIGVPLTLLSIKPTDEIAIVEMGANHPGEIADLCAIAEPDFGIITNIGTAHIEGFLSIENIILTKKALYQSVIQKEGTLFVNDADSTLMDGLDYSRIIYYGGNCEGSLSGSITKMNPQLTLRLLGKEFQTHLTGTYNLNNMVCAATIGRHFGVSDEEIIAAISGYNPSNNRSQIIISGSNTIIADFYNANPSSMRAALENFGAIEAEQKIVILGEMRELGSYSETEHKKVIDWCLAQKVAAIFVGKEFCKHKTADFQFFETLEEAQEYIQKNPIENHFILIKGSHGVHLERLKI